VARAACGALQFGCFWTNGQICSATSRLLLHARIAPAFLARLKKRAEAIQVSDPLAPGCRLGPLVCESQYRKVLSYIHQGVHEGAALLTGGLPRPAGLLRAADGVHRRHAGNGDLERGDLRASTVGD
jgi:acyl-CoA reductase-like NAD-dependent aldehyde dehydrogenase